MNVKVDLLNHSLNKKGSTDPLDEDANCLLQKIWIYPVAR